MKSGDEVSMIMHGFAAFPQHVGRGCKTMHNHAYQVRDSDNTPLVYKDITYQGIKTMGAYGA